MEGITFILQSLQSECIHNEFEIINVEIERDIDREKRIDKCHPT